MSTSSTENPNIVVGVDIGTTKVACFIGIQGTERDSVKILGFGTCPSQGMQSGKVENLQMGAEAIKTAVKRAEESSKIIVDEVYIGIAGNHISSKQNHGEIVIASDNFHIISQEDMDMLMNTQINTILPPGEDIIHIFPMSYEVDHRTLSNSIKPIGVEGHILAGTFHIVTGKRDEVKKLIKCVEMAGYKVKGVVLEPIASAYAVLEDSDWYSGTALVDIGGGTTDIAIFYDDSVCYTSVTPAAGEMVSNDIRKACSIMPEQAEMLKKRFGSCLPNNVKENVIVSIPFTHGRPSREVNLRTLAEIIQTRVKMILDIITYEIEVSNYGKNLMNGITLTGGGACLNHIKEYAELCTGIHCHIGTADIHLEPANDTEEERKKIEEYRNPMYATSIGLVLYGLEKEAEEAMNHKRKAEKETKEPEPIDDTIDIENPPINTQEEKPERKKKRRKIVEVINNWMKWVIEE